jgi:hypothetical protein
MSKVLIKKKPLEIMTLVLLVLLLVAFIISTIVLALRLKHASKNTCDKVCSQGFIDNKSVQQCCTKEQGSPFIDTHNQTMGCKKD